MESQPIQRYEPVDEGRSSLKGDVARLKEAPLKGVYEKPDPFDGFHVLAGKLWSRGVLKTKAAMDEWAKDPTPSVGLRKWFHEDTIGWWDELRSAYHRELEEGDAAPAFLSHASEHVTFVHAGKDVVHNYTKVSRGVPFNIAK